MYGSRDDARQEIVIKALEALRSFDPSRGVKATTFLARAVSRHVGAETIRLKGKKRCPQQPVVSLDAGEPLSEVDPGFAKVDDADEISAFTRRLSKKYREVARRVYLDGEPAHVVAKDLGFVNGARMVNNFRNRVVAALKATTPRKRAAA